MDFKKKKKKKKVGCCVFSRFSYVNDHGWLHSLHCVDGGGVSKFGFWEGGRWGGGWDAKGVHAASRSPGWRLGSTMRRKGFGCDVSSASRATLPNAAPLPLVPFKYLQNAGLDFDLGKMFVFSFFFPVPSPPPPPPTALENPSFIPQPPFPPCLPPRV